METAVVLNLEWQPIYFHVPSNRTAVYVPDSRDLYSVLKEHRDELLGVAHSHPGGGVPSPSGTDITTFASLEADLGKRLIWPIVTVDAFRAFKWIGPGRLDYGAWGKSLSVEMLAPWAPELLRLSV